MPGCREEGVILDIVSKEAKESDSLKKDNLATKLEVNKCAGSTRTVKETSVGTNIQL